MTESKNPLKSMLKIAMATVGNHYTFYSRAANTVQTAKVKALLMVLSETEENLMAKIEDMMITGVVDELQEVSAADIDTPDAMPFDLAREDEDPRIYVCNRALEQELKAYTFFLSVAARAKNEVISRVFEYFAYVKTQQIERIRKVCETF